MKEFVKKEAVLCLSALLAIISVFFVPPSIRYIDYIDLKTISLLKNHMFTNLTMSPMSTYTKIE